MLSIHQIRHEVPQEIRLCAKDGERRLRFFRRAARKLLRLRERGQRHIGRLVVLLITADGLADLLGRADNIENIVRNLEGKPKVVGIRRQCR